jgi:hydrogenase maturation protease
MEETVKRTTPGARRVLVACIGNIFLGDDGFGVEVAQHLISRQYPQGIQIADFGIRGMDLAYALLDNYDMLILVDAIQRGGSPGTLYLIEPDLSALSPEKGVEAGRVALDSHSMDPAKVLAYARTLGAKPIHTLLVGCEPSPLSDSDYTEMQMGLSEPVQAAVSEAVRMIDSLVERTVPISSQG